MDRRNKNKYGNRKRSKRRSKRGGTRKYKDKELRRNHKNKEARDEETK